MLDSGVKILTHLNAYSISFLVLILAFVFSYLSEQFKQYMKMPLQMFLIAWIILFGYRVYTGDNLYTVLTTPSQKEIDAQRYEKHMIDGREVIYDKSTGEIVKPAKK